LRKGIQFNYAVSVCKVKRSLNFTLTWTRYFIFRF